jgi:hypothetical protein
MGVHDFDTLMEHVGHAVEVVPYGPYHDEVNVAIECTDCGEVLVDFDKYPEETHSFTVAITDEDLKNLGLSTDVPLDALVKEMEEYFQEGIFQKVLFRCYHQLKEAVLAN